MNIANYDRSNQVLAGMTPLSVIASCNHLEYCRLCADKFKTYKEQKAERCFICGIQASGYVLVDFGFRDGELWRAHLCNCDYDYIYRKMGYHFYQLKGDKDRREQQC